MLIMAKVTLEDAGELIGSYLGNAEWRRRSPLWEPGNGIIPERRLQDARCVPAF